MLRDHGQSRISDVTQTVAGAYEVADPRWSRGRTLRQIARHPDIDSDECVPRDRAEMTWEYPRAQWPIEEAGSCGRSHCEDV